MFSTQQYSGFDPRSIPGCSLWLDAADSRTITLSGGLVNVWSNKGNAGGFVSSPSGGEATLTTSGGLPCLSFDGTTSRMTGSAFLTGTWISTTGHTAFYVATPTVVDTDNGTTPGLNDTILCDSFGYYGIYLRSSGLIGTFIWDGSAKSVTKSYTIGNRVLATTRHDSTNVSIGSNGSSLTSTAAGAATQVNNIRIGWNSSSSGYYQGLIFEIITFNRALSSTEQQQVEGYLAWKWGLNTNLPAGHISKSNPIATRNFQPIDISGCFLWLDGGDARTVGVSGTNVTAWNDKSGLGNNLTTISATPPTYSSTTGAITFTAANQTAIRGALTSSITNPITTFIVCSITNPGVRTGYNLLMFGTNGSSVTFLAGQLHYVDTATTPAFYTYANNAQNPTGQGTNIQTYIPTTYNTIGIFANSSTYSGTNLTNNTYLNGNTSTYSAVNTTWTVASPYVTSAGYVSIGNDTAGTGGTGGSFNGNIYEVLAFSKTLSTSERQQIEGYLAAKWGLSSSLPTTQPFYLLRSIPSTPIFTPTALSGCQLWLDGYDPNGNGTVPADSSALSTWVDKSGAGNSGTAGGTTPLYQSSGGVLFSTGAYVTNYSASLASESMFFVYNPTDVTNTIALAGPNGTGGRTITVNTNRRLESSSYFVGFGSVSPDGTVTLNQNCQSGYINTAGSTVAVHNGTTYSPVSLSYTAGLTTRIGAAASTLTIFFKGIIREVIAYNVALTTSQRQQVEGYLAWKWGLQNSLPTTHPYYKFRP